MIQLIMIRGDDLGAAMGELSFGLSMVDGGTRRGRTDVVLIKPRLCGGSEETRGGPDTEKHGARNGTGGMIRPDVRNG